MIPYVSKWITDQNKLLFAKIQTIVHRLPDLDLGQDENGVKVLLSCHMVARAIGRVLNLECVDGVYGKTATTHGYAHSWLLTADKKFIIDCYPVGMLGGPLFVDARHDFCPGWHLYKKSRTFGKNILFTSKEFRRSIRLLEDEVKHIVATY